MGRAGLLYHAARHAGRWTSLGSWLPFGLILGLALALRLVHLDVDAPATLSWSGALFTDEGLYSHAARNRVLFGVWRTDGWDNRLVSPLHDALAYLVFRLAGVGYVQLRLISVVWSMLALALLWWLLRRDLGERLALFGAALWGLDYFWLQYSRLGLLEPGMVAWLVLGAWGWRRALDGSAGWAIVSGVAVALAWIWKSLAVLVLPAPLLALLLIGPGWPRRRVAGGYLTGLSIGLLAYWLCWYIPQQAELAAYNRFYAADRVPVSVGELAQALWRNSRSSFVWGQTPVVLVAALLGAGFAAWQVVRGAVSPVVALSLSWAVCGLTLLLMPYSPPRYYTLLLPAWIVLACIGARDADNLVSRQHIGRLLIGILLLSLQWSSLWYVRWIRQAQTTLPSSSRALQTLVPPGELVLGVSACGLSLENTLRCAPPFDGLANHSDPVETLGARFALVEQHSDDFMRRFYEPLLADSTPLQTLPFGRQRVTLYRLDSAAVP